MDKGIDPVGEFGSAKAASAVYRLFRPVPRRRPLTTYAQGTHMRMGGYGVTNLDWRYFLQFLDKHFTRFFAYNGWQREHILPQYFVRGERY